MRAAKVLTVLAIAALGIGSLSAVALAGKKSGKKTTVSFSNQSPNFNSGKVSANGTVVSNCGDGGRLLDDVPMRLQVLDTNGVVLTTLDSSRSESEPIPNHGPASTPLPKGLWTLSGQLPTTLPAGTNYVRVKAKRQTVGGGPGEQPEQKTVCRAGFSPTVAIPAV